MSIRYGVCSGIYQPYHMAPPRVFRSPLKVAPQFIRTIGNTNPRSSRKQRRRKLTKLTKGEKSKSNEPSDEVKSSIRPVTLSIGTKKSKQELLDVEKLGIHAPSKPPQLAFGLERVLYEPLVLHRLYDSRSGMYNFDSKVEKISPMYLERKVEDIIGAKDQNQEDDHKPIFITPHKDNNLIKVANAFSKRYISSTSSMTSVLSHIHFLLSNFRKLNITDTSITNNFPKKHYDFTRGAQFPATMILRRKKHGIISIDSDKSLDREMVLSLLGHSLEDFLTVKPENSSEEHYHYSKIDDFIIRSQLDAYGDHLPGSGVFDLKTRAVVSIRHDLSYVEKNSNFTGYEIDKVYGQFESLEREFFEVIRSTLLKYSLQARMGFMDGIFIAYHNISKIFGFQYLPLDDIDHIIHSGYDAKFKKTLEKRQYILEKIFGQEDFIINHQRNDKEMASKIANKEFEMSISLFRNVLRSVELKLKEMNPNWQKAKLLVKTEKKKIRLRNGRISSVPIMNILAFPLPNDYEDIPLTPIRNFEDSNHLEQQLKKINLKNAELITKIRKEKNLVGFKVQVQHEQRHNADSISIPTYINSRILTNMERSYVMKEINKNYYQKSSLDTPNFFHPSDVEEWNVNEIISPITKLSDMETMYKTYLDEKMEALRYQTVVKESDPFLENSRISQRIRELMAGTVSGRRGKNSTKRSGNEPTDFQNILRAYALKGLKRSKNKINTIRNN